MRSFQRSRPILREFERMLETNRFALFGVFALSELAYFHGVQKSVENASLAYDTYFLGHAEWFNSDAGRYLLAHLRHWAARLVNPKES